MFKISRIAAFIGLLIPTSIMAQSIQGEVKNNDGKAIAGARLELKEQVLSLSLIKMVSLLFMI